MEALAGFLTDDEDMLELIDVVGRQRARKIFRDREDHFLKWSDTEFLRRFRLSKHGVHFILDNITEHISHPTERNNAVLAETMLFVALRFYATGSFIQVAADFVGIDKSTACRIIHKVSRAIARMHQTFIKMPTNDEEMLHNSAEFYNISRFPKCIGAVDCTHIKISSPGGDQAETFRNRKNFFSLNVQVICDAKCKFQNIVCRWPGSSHDSTIFNNNCVRAQFENREFGRYVLVGDSGYGIKPYLITPLLQPVTRAEQLFNESQIRTRNPIERSFGMWKRRFPVLAFGIRVKINRVEAIVIATAILHNIAVMLNEELPPLDVNEEEALEFVNNVYVEPVQNNIGGINNAVRYQLIHQYFTRLL